MPRIDENANLAICLPLNWLPTHLTARAPQTINQSSLHMETNDEQGHAEAEEHVVKTIVI
jgi:hypothetical protein